MHARAVFPTRFSVAEILVLAGTAGAGGMAPPAITSIFARLKCVQGHVLPVNIQGELGVAGGATGRRCGLPVWLARLLLGGCGRRLASVCFWDGT